MAGNPANALSIIGAFEAGQGQGDRRTRRNALANYASATTPEMQANALNPLVAMGDFETLDSARNFNERRQFDHTRREIAPAIREGRFGDAARTAAGSGQVDLAAQMFQLDQAGLQNAKARGERGAAAVMAGAALPDPEQRRQYFMRPDVTQLAGEMGFTPEQLAGFDYSNTDMLRAVASRWLDAARLAGDVSLQKFGDNVQTVRTGPMGSEVLDSREIPVTRAEQLDRRQVEYREQADQRDFGYRQQRDQADDQYREKALDVRGAVNSAGDVVGPVLAKVAAYGEDALTEGERLIFDRYQQGGQSAGAFGMATPPPPPGTPPMDTAPMPRPALRPSGSAPAAPSRPAAGGPVGTRANPARPATPEEAARLPSGSFFVDPSGAVRQRP